MKATTKEINEGLGLLHLRNLLRGMEENDPQRWNYFVKTMESRHTCAFWLRFPSIEELQEAYMSFEQCQKTEGILDELFQGDETLKEFTSKSATILNFVSKNTKSYTAEVLLHPDIVSKMNRSIRLIREASALLRGIPVNPNKVGKSLKKGRSKKTAGR